MHAGTSLRRPGLPVLLLLLSFLGLKATTQAQYSVRVGVDPETAWVGQEVHLVIQVWKHRVRSKAREGSCKLATVPGLRFEEVMSGPPSVFRMENANFLVWQFAYRIHADQAGSYRIPGPELVVDGTPLRGRATTLRLDDPAKQSEVFLRLHANPPTVVPGQTVELICDIDMKELPSELGTRDHFAVYGGRSFFSRNPEAPALSLPWIQVNGRQLRSDFEGFSRFDAARWLETLGRGSSFRLAGLRGALPPGKSSEVTREVEGKSVKYRRFRYSCSLRAQKVGTWSFDPARFEGKVVIDRGAHLAARNRFAFRDVFARSKALKVTVAELPSEERPASFGGAVGQFRFTMEPPSPTTLSEGSPVFMTFVATGEGLLKGVTLDLESQLGDQFRVEALGTTDSKPAGEKLPPGFPNRPGPWRQFDFKVYPLSTRVKTIPPVSFSWYDPAAKSWEEAKTEAVALNVKPRGGGTSGVVVAGERKASDVELIATSSLSNNVADLNLLGNQRPRLTLWLGLSVGLGVLYAALSFLVTRRRRLHGDPASLRARGANSRARSRFESAKRQAASEPMAALDEAQAALRGLVADFTNRDESALTGAEVVAWLESSGASEELREAMQRLNDAVEACHFGGGAPPRDRLDTLLAALTPIFEMGKGGDRKGAVRAPSVLLLLALLSGVAMAQDVETFQSAQAAFARGDAEEAARLFSSMLDAGYENGYVLYNLGNCQLRAGKIGEAIAAYRRASLYLPGDANVALNLQRALDARSEPLSLPESRPISDYVLFWRSHLSAGSELRITALCAALAFALALVRLLVGRRLTAVLWSVRILALIALLFGISAALDAQALNARDHGATCGEATVVRSGPGESFEPSYEQSIGAGAEFEVLGRSGEWLQVRIAGRYEGWIAESSAALW